MNLWAIFGTALLGVMTLAMDWMKTAQAQRTGGQLQAGATAAVTAKVETAVAQAEVDAPKTRLAVVDRLNAGTF